MQRGIKSKEGHKPNTHILYLPGWDVAIVCLITILLCPIGHPTTITELFPNRNKQVSGESKSEPFNFHTEDGLSQVEQ